MALFASAPAPSNRSLFSPFALVSALIVSLLCAVSPFELSVAVSVSAQSETPLRIPPPPPALVPTSLQAKPLSPKPSSESNPNPDSPAAPPSSAAAKKSSPTAKPPSGPVSGFRVAPIGEPVRPRSDGYETAGKGNATFFGVKAEGKFFVYVVDRSGSMGAGSRMLRAKRELRESVNRLEFGQQFAVIFYNETPFSVNQGSPLSADSSSKRKLAQFLNIIEPDGQTDPRAAIRQALTLQPDAVFLLSDGEYPRGVVDSIRQANHQSIPIHCVDLSGGRSGGDLQRIAAESGGQYAVR